VGSPSGRKEFAEGWSRFCELLRFSSDRLVGELSSCWHDQRAILHQLATGAPFSAAEAPSLPQYRQERAAQFNSLFLEPYADLQRKSPYKRALAALETFDRGRAELLKTLPESVVATPAEVAQSLGVRLPGWRKLDWRKRLSVPVRNLVSARWMRLTARRQGLEDQYLSALARGVRAVRRPWDVVGELVDAAAQGRPFADDDAQERWSAMRGELEAVIREGDAAAAEWNLWPERARPSLARAMLAPDWRLTMLRPRNSDGTAPWVRLWRRLDADLRLEESLYACEEALAELVVSTFASAAEEQRGVGRELGRVLEWLERQVASEGREPFPEPEASVIPAASRLAELEGSFSAALASLPVTHAAPRIGRRRQPKRGALAPREVFRHAFLRNTRPRAGALLAEIETEHQKILQEIERAREVVAFARESDPALFNEAVGNAQTLLRYYRDASSNWAERASRELSGALAEAYFESRLMLRRQRVGAAAFVARQGVRRMLPLAAKLAQSAARQSLESSADFSRHSWDRFLIAIGWRSRIPAGRSDVIARPALPEAYAARGRRDLLPPLYRHLFRLEPVQDPRFLVGRELELSAIAEACESRRSGRPAAVIIAGERGSGKTSIIECAQKQFLRDAPVIRGEFCERLTREEEMLEFMARLTGADGPSALEGYINEKRPVIILEELERTFLRQIGHFGALLALRRLIAATCRNALWILSVNAVAFRFMNASLQFGAIFSHRINAATATEANLRRTILQRHGLSGLRLEFLPPPAGNSVLSGAGSFGSGSPPQERFFADLASESRGVFRTAFDIWLGHVETVEAGVLYMKPFQRPDLDALIHALDRADLFTLHAILQHGSLTAEEHSVVFHGSIASSRAQLDELLGRELIEPEPTRPGFRVRPDAVRIVKEALHQRNLL
jgi:hypothetical protein